MIALKPRNMLFIKIIVFHKIFLRKNIAIWVKNNFNEIINVIMIIIIVTFTVSKLTVFKERVGFEPTHDIAAA